jgi:hypothetical protein
MHEQFYNCDISVKLSKSYSKLYISVLNIFNHTKKVAISTVNYKVDLKILQRNYLI